MSEEVDGESISSSPSHLPQPLDNLISVKDLDWWLNVLAHWEIFSTIQLWECLSPAYEPSYLSIVLPLSQDLHTPNIPTPIPALLGRTDLQHPSLARKG